MKKTTLTLTAAVLASLLNTGCAPLLIGGAMVGTVQVATDRRTSATQLEDETIEFKAGARIREQLALLIAQENHCTYCVSAHTLRGSRLGLTDAELARTREASDDSDPHADAVLRLTREIIHTRGRVDDAALADARNAGVTDAELAEIVAHIALNTLSNYFNHLAQPDLDFPEVAA